MVPTDERVFVALDLPTVDEAEALVDRLGDSVASYKIGLQLLPIGGARTSFWTSNFTTLTQRWKRRRVRSRVSMRNF